MPNWFVYIIECSDNSLYTGITTDVGRRFAEHCDGKKGAKYFRKCNPQTVVYSEACPDRSVASKREAEIKNLTRQQKYQLIEISPLTKSIGNGKNPEI